MEPTVRRYIEGCSYPELQILNKMVGYRMQNESIKRKAAALSALKIGQRIKFFDPRKNRWREGDIVRLSGFMTNSHRVYVMSDGEYQLTRWLDRRTGRHEARYTDEVPMGWEIEVIDGHV